MFKLFGKIGFRIALEMVLMLAAVWFYLVLQEPTFFNQVLFWPVFVALLVGFCVDMKLTLDRFINTPSR